MKKTRYFIEAVFLRIIFLLFKALPPQNASNIGGWLGRNIGSRMATSRKAYSHVSQCFPNLNQDEINNIVRGMWDNLGRVIAEYPHLERISKEYTTLHDLGCLNNYIANKTSIVFIGAHLSNWEINGAATLTQLKQPIALTYRAPNNPWVAKMLDNARTLNGRLESFPKSRESGRKIIKTLKNSGSVGILIDQKYNEGVEADFFGMPAMTNPVFVQLCQKYKCPLIPVQTERIGGCHFKITTHKSIEVLNQDGSPRAVKDVINEANKILETWITKRPEQWLWLHNRWKK